MLLSLLRGVWLFGAARRLAAAAAELLLRPLQVQGQAARPCCTPTPTRPAALFRAPPHFPKTGIFRKKISPARKYFNLAHWARQHWFKLRSLGTFVSERFPDKSSRRRNKCDLPEISPRVSPPPPKQNSQQLSTALGLTVGECQRDFAKKKSRESEKLFVRRCLRGPPVAVWPVSNGRGLGWKAGASAGVKEGASSQGGGRPWWP